MVNNIGRDGGQPAAHPTVWQLFMMLMVGGVMLAGVVVLLTILILTVAHPVDMFSGERSDQLPPPEVENFRPGPSTRSLRTGGMYVRNLPNDISRIRKSYHRMTPHHLGPVDSMVFEDGNRVGGLSNWPEGAWLETWNDQTRWPYLGTAWTKDHESEVVVFENGWAMVQRTNAQPVLLSDLDDPGTITEFYDLEFPGEDDR